LEQASALYDPQRHRWQAFLYGFDSGVVSLSYGALSLAILGYPDQARQRSQEAISLAQAVSHPFSLAAGQFWATWLHYLRREWPAIQERSEAVITLATEQGFRFWLATGTILRGAGLVEQGEFEAGVAHLRQGLAATLSAGATVARSWFLALLAEAYGKGGQPEEGLTVLAEALMFVEQNDERFWEADLYRLQGELLLMLGKPEAETCFRQAIEVARRQEAKLLELRAVVSLCRLLQKQGRGEEGRQMLSVIYNWFTEGFDTLDLIEAGKLLKELQPA
jgi:predicted ATPase